MDDYADVVVGELEVSCQQQGKKHPLTSARACVRRARVQGPSFTLSYRIFLLG